MRYISTRGRAPALSFDDVLLAGLAEDGGLYVPQDWPVFTTAEWRAMRGMDYPSLVARILAPFVGATIDQPTLERLAAEAYSGFSHQAIAPLVQIDRGMFVLELFHGPTLAFKDFALQLLGRLFDHVLAARGERVTIVGATSGDTGSAAIAACRDKSNLDIVILHPEGRTSPVQRRQMTTVQAGNVLNVAVDGSFDDCQDLVKAMFADTPFRRTLRLSAVNSINWARIAAQIPYYVHAALALGAPDRPVAFAVPTGNFGNVLAAWGALRMGLPVERLVIGTNRNDILARFIAANDMSVQGVVPSHSPSMDIQVSSNFERLLFELLGRDATATEDAMTSFRAHGRMPVPDAAWREATALFRARAVDDPATLARIAATEAASGYLADPHTAIGIEAALAHRPDDDAIPVIVAGTAHPAKFADAILAATGRRPPVPPALAGLDGMAEHFIRARNDLGEIQALVRGLVLRNAA